MLFFSNIELLGRCGARRSDHLFDRFRRQRRLQDAFSE
jgi:hypothetical protein